MNILIYTCDYKPMLGGIAEYLYNVAKELQKRHNVIVLAPDMPEAAAFDKEQPFTTYRYKNTGMKKHLLSVTDLLRVIKKEQIEFIFAGMYYPAGLLCYLSFFSHKLPYLIPAYAVEILDSENGLAQKIKKRMRWLRQRIFNKSVGVIAISQYTKEKVERIGVLAEKIHVIPCGVDKAQIPQQLTTIKKDSISLLTVARIVDYKGQDVVIKALPKVLETYPNVMYTIVGTGPYEDELKKLVQELKLEEHVEFRGAVSEKEKYRLYNMCDIFLMCSRAYEERPDVEGFGIVFLEAHMYKKPVIGGNSGGIPDAILDGKTGLLATPESPDDVAEKICRILGDKQLATTLGENGYKRITTELNWEAIVPNMEKIICQHSK